MYNIDSDVSYEFMINDYGDQGVLKNLNLTFSASYIKMTITFDVLNGLQEDKLFRTAQTMNNILRSNTKW